LGIIGEEMIKDTLYKFIVDITSIPSFWVIIIMIGLCSSLIFGDLEKVFQQSLNDYLILLLKLLLITIILSYMVIIKIEIKYFKKRKK
jgi:uncharacterized protein with PQ loop repeat